MPTCSTGASVAPGHNPNAEIVISRAQWEALTGTASSWMDPLLDTFQPSIAKVSDLCALNVDDPGDLTLSTIISAFLKNPAALLDVAQWARAKMSYLAFQANCVCNSTGGVCLNLFGTPIPGLPNSATNGSGRYDLGMKFHCVSVCDVSSVEWAQYTVTPPATRNIKLWNLTAGTLIWSQAVTLPGSSSVVTPCTTVTTLVPGNDYAITFDFLTGDSLNLINSGWGGASNAFITSSGRIDNFSAGTGAPARFFGGLAVPIQPIVCPTTSIPPAPTIPIQPPDLVLPPSWGCASIGDICTRLQQISDRLDWARADITLIQRQHVPFAYLLGTPSSGLTGSGFISVQGILGAVVSLTTVPTSWGRTQDTPRRLIPAAGQLMFSTTNGDSMAELVHYDHDMVLGVSGVVTSIKYSFRPGIVATITPLSRES